MKAYSKKKIKCIDCNNLLMPNVFYPNIETMGQSWEGYKTINARCKITMRLVIMNNECQKDIHKNIPKDKQEIRGQ